MIQFDNLNPVKTKQKVTSHQDSLFDDFYREFDMNLNWTSVNDVTINQTCNNTENKNEMETNIQTDMENVENNIETNIEISEPNVTFDEQVKQFHLRYYQPLDSSHSLLRVRPEVEDNLKQLNQSSVLKDENAKIIRVCPANPLQLLITVTHNNDKIKQAIMKALGSTDLTDFIFEVEPIEQSYVYDTQIKPKLTQTGTIKAVQTK